MYINIVTAKPKNNKALIKYFISSILYWFKDITTFLFFIANGSVFRLIVFSDNGIIKLILLSLLMSELLANVPSTFLWSSKLTVKLLSVSTPYEASKLFAISL